MSRVCAFDGRSAGFDAFYTIVYYVDGKARGKNRDVGLIEEHLMAVAFAGVVCLKHTGPGG